jgi:hypothetical protein
MKQKLTTIFLLFFATVSAFAQLSGYTFSTLNASYTPIVGGTVLGDANTDDARFVNPANLGGGNMVNGPGFPIGFNFTFDGVVFDRFGINANGWIVLGNSTNTPAVTVGGNQGGNYSPISAADAGFVQVISPLGLDIQAQTGAELRIETMGTSPNKVCIIQWDGYRKYNETGDDFNFQIKLYETTNIIDFHYGAFINNSTDGDVEVGLKGNTFANFINRQGNNWTSSNAGTVNDAKMDLTATTTPANGTIYRWSPPVQTVLDPQALIFVTPINSGCLSSAEVVTVRVRNNGLSAINFMVNNLLLNVSVTGANPINFPPLIINSGTLAVGATTDIVVSTSYNMTNIGTYNFAGTLAMTTDGNTANNTFQNMTRTVIATKTVPYQQNFDGTTNLFSLDWSGDMGIEQNHGVNNSNGLTVNMWGNNQDAFGVTPKIGPLLSTTALRFDYRILNWVNNGYPNNTDSTVISNQDSINIEISSECGIIYTNVFSITGANHIPSKNFRTMTISLGAYVGQKVFIRFRNNWNAGDYYVDIDNINIDSPQGIDMKAISFVSPVQGNCLSAGETVKVRVQNYGTTTLDFAANNLVLNTKVSGAVSQTFSPVIINSGTLATGNTMDITVNNSFNMTSGGLYKFEAVSMLSGDANALNDTIKSDITVPQSTTLPYTQNFDNTSSLGAISWSGNMNISINHGVGNTYGLNSNMWNNNQVANAGTLKLLNIQPSSTFSFDYRILEYVFNNYPDDADSTILSNADSIFIEASLDCGVTFTDLLVITGANHTPTRSFTTKNLSLGTLMGNDIYVRFRLKWATGDYYVDIDNINIQSPGATGTKTFVANSKQVSVFPNPTSGIFTVNLPTTNEVILKLTNAVGQEIMTEKMTGTTQIDLSSYQQGIYTLTIQDEKSITTKKINLIK